MRPSRALTHVYIQLDTKTPQPCQGVKYRLQNSFQTNCLHHIKRPDMDVWLGQPFVRSKTLSKAGT